MQYSIKEVFSPKLFTTLRSYSAAQLGQDALAGIIVGIVAIPLAIAFGISSGVGPTEGLVTAIIAGLLISLFGGSKVQIGGPTGAFIVIIYGIIQEFGLGGLMIATVMAGILLVIMGLTKLGSVIKFVPYPVIVGFTAGIALTIFSTQMNDFFGLGLTNVPANFIDKWIYYTQHFRVHWWSFGIGVFSLLICIFMPKITKRIPGSLAAIIIATAAVWLLKGYAPEGWEVGGIQTISDLYTLPHGIPAPHLEAPLPPEGGGTESWFTMIQKLFPAAFTIAMLGAIESLLSAMVADGVIGDKHNSNTELIAQGIANIVVPFFGGIPATGAIARTMTNINNGGRTPIAGIIHAAIHGQVSRYDPDELSGGGADHGGLFDERMEDDSRSIQASQPRFLGAGNHLLPDGDLRPDGSDRGRYLAGDGSVPDAYERGDAYPYVPRRDRPERRHGEQYEPGAPDDPGRGRGVRDRRSVFLRYSEPFRRRDGSCEQREISGAYHPNAQGAVRGFDGDAQPEYADRAVAQRGNDDHPVGCERPCAQAADDRGNRAADGPA